MIGIYIQVIIRVILLISTCNEIYLLLIVIIHFIWFKVLLFLIKRFSLIVYKTIIYTIYYYILLLNFSTTAISI